MRREPNIIITGTPGVGKTSHCDVLREQDSLKHLSVNDIVKEHGCHDGWDESRQCWVVDDSRVSINYLHIYIENLWQSTQDAHILTQGDTMCCQGRSS
jgi:broad-specificity NMP kinase